MSSPSSPSILADLKQIQAYHDDIRLIADRTNAREQKARARLIVARGAIREIINGTAARLGLAPTLVAICDGQHAAVMAEDGEVLVYRVSMIGPDPFAPTANPARDAADVAGHAAYSCGCTPKEAGVPCDGLDFSFEFSPDHVVGLGPLAEPLVAHPLANGHARPAVADAVADLAPDDEGFVPASALGAMREAAASQTWGASSNAIG
jgi:hypothetical protein